MASVRLLPQPFGDEVVDFLVLIVRYRRLAVGRLDVAVVVDLLGEDRTPDVLQRLPSQFLRLQLEVVLDDLGPHLMVVRYLILDHPFVLEVADGRALHRVDVEGVQLGEKSLPRRPLVPTAEGTVLVAESDVVLANQLRQHFARFVAVQMVPVEEAPHLLRVSVQVQNQGVLLACFEDLLFEGVDDGSDAFIGFFPAPVGVYSREFCPGVAVDDSIRVEHRYYFEDVVVIDIGGRSFDCDELAQHMADDPFDHVAGSSLNGVLSPQHPDSPALAGRPLPGGDVDHIDHVFPHRLRPLLDDQAVLELLLEEDGVEVGLQLGVGVGVGGREVDAVVGLSELVLEGEAEEVGVFALPFEAVLLIEHLLAGPHPPDVGLGVVLLRESEGLEPVVEESVLLGQVHDVEPGSYIPLGVGHFEVKPLVMSLRVDVVLQDQIVRFDSSFLLGLVDCQEIAGLEVRVKDQPFSLGVGFVQLIFGPDVREVVFVFGVFELDSRDGKEYVGEVVPLHGGGEPAVVGLFIMVVIPKGGEGVGPIFRLVVGVI